MLEETRLTGEVELEIYEGGILIRNILKPRGNWDSLFKSMGDNDDDLPLEGNARTEFEKKEWQW